MSRVVRFHHAHPHQCGHKKRATIDSIAALHVWCLEATLGLSITLRTGSGGQSSPGNQYVYYLTEIIRRATCEMLQSIGAQHISGTRDIRLVNLVNETFYAARDQVT